MGSFEQRLVGLALTHKDKTILLRAIMRSILFSERERDACYQLADKGPTAKIRNEAAALGDEHDDEAIALEELAGRLR